MTAVKSELYFPLQIPVEEAIKHEDYLRSDWHTSNDIALLRLARPVETGPNIIPVCLPHEGNEWEPENPGFATVCGFGRTSSRRFDKGDTFVSEISLSVQLGRYV